MASHTSFKLLLCLIPLYIIVTAALVFLGISDIPVRLRKSQTPFEPEISDKSEIANTWLTNSREFCYANLYDSDNSEDLNTVCSVKCPVGSRTFALPGMTQCRSWLNCEEISQLRNIRHLAESEVKNVQLADWHRWKVVYTTPRNLSSFDFVFNQTTRNVISLSLDHSKHFTQLLGVCGYSTVVEYSPLGTLWNLEKIMKRTEVLKSYDNLATRFRMCYSLAEAFQFLLHTSLGVRVMADIDYWEKAFSQFLITNDLRVIMNDVDMLLSNGSYFDCRVNHPYTDFVPPEVNCEYLRTFDPVEGLNELLQIDLFVKPVKGSEPLEFISQIFHQYNIWKIPDFCNFIFADFLDSEETLRNDIDDVFAQCRNVKWFERPTADQVTHSLKLIADDYSINLKQPTLNKI